ncbi:uncharacterized protein BXZ73DRAFT_105211 [Epithele typhae]|uniref:uncharacterized protein n=1 Tax=Epithele typhae TaxID=378194 RepID=UPI002008A45E|nr:uncharacterized protein BXZ73DRAFT_105211 [Epithele typhae]KAH9918576.1 hypothetical protein BXZ73DRAFT_105211 [Epithele typhae]
MQFKSLIAVLSLIAVAASAPQAASDNFASANVSLSTGVTTQTFTATQVFQRLMSVPPFVTTITTHTVFTATRTGTFAIPTGSA